MKKTIFALLLALGTLVSCSTQPENRSNDVASLFEKYKQVEGVVYEDQTAQKDSLLVKDADKMDASAIEELKGIRIEILQFTGEIGDTTLLAQVKNDLTELKDYEKVDPSTFFKPVPPAMKVIFEDMEGFIKKENGETNDRLIVIDGCAFVFIHVEGKVSDKTLRNVMRLG